MDFTKEALEQIARKASDAPSFKALVGLDGFVDIIVRAVDKRHGKGDQFTPIRTIPDFGGRISAAAGKSTNIEMYPTQTKIGGNGPIMANAILSMGIQTRYIGALGKPTINPVFNDFAAATQAISVANPGVTHAAEFTDGKILFGELSSLDDITFQSVLSQIGEGAFFDLVSRADLVSMVNWTMIPGMTNFLEGLIDRVLPNLGPVDSRHYFFDLADPEKRADSEIRAVLHTISKFQNFGSVTLGLNHKEAEHIGSILGHNEPSDHPDGLRRLASAIRREMQISCTVVHPTDAAACATREDSWYVEGYYTPEPLISTGAGDHFNSGFAAGRLFGFHPGVCLRLATAVSGYYVRNAASPNLSQVSELIRNLTPSRKKA